MLPEAFYSRFEDKFRGPKEIIKKRQSFYLQFLNLFDDLPKIGLDIGCGRGEFLEILEAAGFEAKGIDMNSQMLSQAQIRNLKVEKAMAIDYLKNLPNTSVSVISAFHVIEHLAIQDVYTLIQESFRVLKPCGLLMLESPNYENLFVGLGSFYTDPTHIRPIPYSLVNFIITDIGYKRTHIAFLNGPNVPKENFGIKHLFHCISPDYGIIAQKDGPLAQMQRFDFLFSQEPQGLSLNKGLDLYSQSIEGLIFDLAGKVNRYENIIFKLKQSLVFKMLKFLRVW